jgi:hypothetical protein
MAAAMLFWGWETGMLAIAAPLAAVLECARYTSARWELSDTDLNRISDLCAVLFGAAGLLLYSVEDRLLFIFKLVQWTPVCIFPLMLAQAYGNRARMNLSVFWWLLRRSPQSATAKRAYNISYPYFGCVLLAASTSTRPNSFFYPGVTLLVALALSSARPRRISLAAWISLLLLVAMAGQFSHRQLRQAQTAMEIVLGGWIASLFGAQQEPRELSTMIGHAGPIPQSGRIILRVYAQPDSFMPQLLRESVWDAYRKETWSASNNEAIPANPGSSETIKFLPTNNLSSEIEIARYYRNGQGTLALPHGTFELTEVPANVRTNRLGVVTIDTAPGLMIFHALYGPGKSFDSSPGQRDLLIPSTEAPMLSNVVHELKLEPMSDRQKIRAVSQYFAKNFTYTLDPPRRRTSLQQTWLGYFLQNSHRGHCEYFATATVLLLRAAGIPARYVTGYGIPESARHGSTYLVRERDAHAWALAYHRDTGLWEQVDNTPADWSKSAAHPPWWEPAYDVVSNLYFQFSKWRWSKTSFARYTSWLLIPLIFYLVIRIILNQRRQRREENAAGLQPPGWPGLDSELYLINRRLEPVHLARLPNEPLHSWQQRLEQAFPDSERLRRIFYLHRSLRFDPHGLPPAERETLRAEAQHWLDDFTARENARHPEQP